jgi:hypothetical protein
MTLKCMALSVRLGGDSALPPCVSSSLFLRLLSGKASTHRYHRVAASHPCKAGWMGRPTLSLQGRFLPLEQTAIRVLTHALVCLPALHLPCRLQQIRSSWQEHPNNNNAVMRLTPECRDLLDKMFDTNQVGWRDQTGPGNSQDWGTRGKVFAMPCTMLTVCCIALAEQLCRQMLRVAHMLDGDNASGVLT